MSAPKEFWELSKCLSKLRSDDFKHQQLAAMHLKAHAIREARIRTSQVRMLLSIDSFRRQWFFLPCYVCVNMSGISMWASWVTIAAIARVLNVWLCGLFERQEFNLYMEEICKNIHDFCGSHNRSERMGGILLIRNLVDVVYAEHDLHLQKLGLPPKLTCNICT